MTKPTGRPQGRPRKYQTPEQFDAAVDAYVARCKAEDGPITWTGTALALGFTSRQAIDKYLDYEEFYDSVKRAKLLVEHSYELRLHGNSPTGAIFALKNMGWSDHTQVDNVSSDGSMTPKVMTLAELYGEGA